MIIQLSSDHISSHESASAVKAIQLRNIDCLLCNTNQIMCPEKIKVQGSRFKVSIQDDEFVTKPCFKGN